MIPGNGHPYSWSAIINGYDPVKMAQSGYPGILKYLSAEPLHNVNIADAEVTHIWTDNPADAPLVAAAAKISHVVDTPEDVIGEVDAVILATDDGADHVRRARPFIEAGLPVFIDKPMASTREEMSQFMKWRNAGAKILSSSGLRYAPELSSLRGMEWVWLTSVTCKTWERYGIHALEPIYLLLGSGFDEIRCESQPGSDIVYGRHESGAQVTVAALRDALGCFGVIHAYGKDMERSIRMSDTYTAFRSQLVAVVDWLRSGKEPYPFAETVELMAIVIAAQESRELGGVKVSIRSILDNLYNEK